MIKTLLKAKKIKLDWRGTFLYFQNGVFIIIIKLRGNLVFDQI